VVDHQGRFVWYELLTTDIAAAQVFYGKVVGWDARDASTSDFAYRMFTVGNAPMAGLMNLPEEGLRKGATPRWAGYVAADDVDMTAARIRHLGGTLYVPPTDSNIGRISVIADPQTATLALVSGLKPAEAAAPPDQPGGVGWHELFAADHRKAFAFYREVFGWQKADAEPGATEAYQLFSAGGETIGGMFTKLAKAPIPFWLYYFTVDDIGAALDRVTEAGGQIFEGPFKLVGDSAIARCVDPQGAMFALLGLRGGEAVVDPPATGEIGWSTAWGGISSRGRLVADRGPEPKSKSNKPKSKA
jgi:predicted enzyme related to lactoylglutathione lyase